jgi:hypothetical protein
MAINTKEMAEEEFPEFCRKTPTYHGNYGT